MSRLPNEVRMKWAREGAGEKWCLIFLQEEIESIERSEVFFSNNATIFSKYTVLIVLVNEYSNVLGLVTYFPSRGLKYYVLLQRYLTLCVSLVPFVMCGKILFQEVWRLGLPWDDLLP